MNFTQNDFKIIRALLDRDDRTKGLCLNNGTTIVEVAQKTGLSDKKIRTSLNEFIKVGYVVEALKVGKAKSYIVTDVGLLELKKIRINVLGEM